MFIIVDTVTKRMVRINWTNDAVMHLGFDTNCPVAAFTEQSDADAAALEGATNECYYRHSLAMKQAVLAVVVLDSSPYV